MTTAQPQDTAGGAEAAAHTTLHVDRVTRLAAQFPNDHKIRDGKILLSADAHAKLGNKDTVRALQTHNMDLSTTWERFEHYGFDISMSSSWSYQDISTGNSNGIEHMKDVNCKFLVEAPKSAVGSVHLRFVVYNKQLQGNVKDELDAIQDDYGINRRDRRILYFASPDISLMYDLETRFNGILLRADDAFGMGRSLDLGSQGSPKLSFLITGHTREMDKGGF